MMFPLRITTPVHHCSSRKST